MKIKTLLMLALVTSLTTGCASGLNSMQKREYQAFKNDNVLVEEKNPSTGAALGILPGGGSFYAREPGLGIVNLLLWPISVLWDPISGYQGAMEINYDITKQKLQRDKSKEIAKLEDKLATGELNTTEYVMNKRKVEEKYSYE